MGRASKRRPLTLLGRHQYRRSGPVRGEIAGQAVAKQPSRAEGRTLLILSEASVTLQQVLLLNKLGDVGDGTLSAMADLMRMSAPAISQTIDRLVEIGLVARTEEQADRRRKRIGVTTTDRRLLERLNEARSPDYLAGIAPLSQRVRSDLARGLAAALSELA